MTVNRTTYKRLDILTPEPTAAGADMLQDDIKMIDDVIAAIPDGGTAGQVLKKTSGTDYDTEWADNPSTITVDSALSTTSTNPVQNAVITTALNGKISNGELATVATTGAYSDLTGTPTIPEAYTLPTASSSTLGGVKVGTNLAITNGVLSASTGTTANTVSAGNHTHAYSAITGKPTLATVAATGSYNDLTNQPTVDSALSTTSQNAIQNAIATQAINGKADYSHTHVTGDITNFPELAAVARTGAYSDLTGTPTEYVLPAATSTTLGGVKPDGTTITVDSGGNISAVQSGGSSIANPLYGNSLLLSSNYEWVEESPMDVSTTTNVNAVLARNSNYDGLSWVNVSAFGGSGNTYTAGTGLTLTGTQFSVTPNTYSAINHTHDYTAITNTPTLATVAATGSYSDLTGTPTIPAAYSLPTASTSTLGGVKIDGTTITITDGVISSTGGGSSTLSGLTDVTISSASSGQALIYNGSNWVNGTTSCGTKVVTADGKTSLQATNLTPTYPGNTRGDGAVDLQQHRNDNNQVASGYCSVAMGEGNTASGNCSAAMGCNNAASGYCSVAMGWGNRTINNHATAIGIENYSFSQGAVAIGYGNAAKAVGSVAMGYFNKTMAVGSVATGYDTRIAKEYVVGNNCHVGGQDSDYGHAGIKGIVVTSSVPIIPLDVSEAAVLRIQVIAMMLNGAWETGESCLVITSSSIQKIVNVFSDTTLEFTMSNGELYLSTVGGSTYLVAQVGVWYTLYSNTGGGGSSSSG